MGALAKLCRGGGLTLGCAEEEGADSQSVFFVFIKENQETSGMQLSKGYPVVRKINIIKA